MYISPKVIWLSKFSAILLIIIAAAKLVPAHHNHSEGHSCCDHGHVCGSNHHNSKGIIQFAIFIIPLILGFVMQPRVLASKALSNSINTAGSLPFYTSHLPISDKLSNLVLYPSGSSVVKKDVIPKESDLMQLYLNIDVHPEEVYNQPWKLTGFVYKDHKLAKNQFVISRFVITCCIVDAAPIGIIVESPNAQNLKADTWVEVDGILQKRLISGANNIKTVRNFHATNEGVPYLVAAHCRIIATPKNPYLDPPLQ